MRSRLRLNDKRKKKKENRKRYKAKRKKKKENEKGKKQKAKGKKQKAKGKKQINVKAAHRFVANRLFPSFVRYAIIYTNISSYL
ncbi:hypothetical protein FHS16_003112 [Paenibacillus endophyticus]|uniref:Uncharacterized protein n=1 Tax=Paenibacillus endophyticus TaxID=1294268 RepID=A0A7W5GB67_9BACL|nr:hypothetical protein [Paenibacillus endophyticus]MBB3153053.1 hypothetical protein [Paenibacillus endophyticus]